MARSSSSSGARTHQPEALARSGFQPYRPDDRSTVAAAAAAAAAAGVYPLDSFPPFNTMPLPAGTCNIRFIHSHKKQNFINNPNSSLSHSRSFSLQNFCTYAQLFSNAT